MEKEYISYRQFGVMCDLLVKKIKRDNKKNIVGVYGIPRGGTSIALHLSHRLDIPLLSNFAEFFTNNQKKYILLCDDISDTGRTLNQYLNLSNDIITVTLHCKPKTLVVPNYYCEMTDFWQIYPWETEYSEPSDYHKKVYPELYKCDTVLCGNANQEMLDSLHSLTKKKEIHHYDSGGDDLGICEFLDDISNGRSIE